jgi:hypothetical protein
MRLIAEAEHIHHSAEEYAQEFQEFCCRLGADSPDSVLSDESGWLEA